MSVRPDGFNSLWMLKKLTNKKGDSDKADNNNKNDNASSSQPQDNQADTEAEDRSTRADILGDDRPRVLAYSDSDSDVESHFKRVKDHLLPGHDEKKTADEATGTGEVDENGNPVENADPESAAASKTATTSKTKNNVANNTKKAVTQLGAAVASQVSPLIAVEAAGMLYLQQSQRKAVDVVQIGACALSLASAIFKKLLPQAGLADTITKNINDLGKASLLAATIRFLYQHHKKMALKNSIGRRHSVNLSVLESAVRSDPIKPPETAADYAAVYAPEMLEMQRILKECGIELSPPRFDENHAELFRFAESCGLLTVQTPLERSVVIEKAVRRLIEAWEWQQEQTLLSDSKLKRWERLVAWRSSDSHGRPILLIRAGRALQLCKHNKLTQFVDAVVAQVINGVDTKLSNPDGPEKMVVVMDCRETSSIDLLLKSREVTALIRKTAVALNAHFPSRLEKMYLLELPLLGKSTLQAIQPLLHPATLSKIASASASDDGLPITVALLWKKRSVGKMLSRTMSDLSSCATSDTAEGYSGRSSPYTPGSPRGEFFPPTQTAGSNPATGGGGGADNTGGSGGGASSIATPAINLLPVLEAQQGSDTKGAGTVYKTPFLGSDGGDSARTAASISSIGGTTIGTTTPNSNDGGNNNTTTTSGGAETSALYSGYENGGDDDSDRADTSTIKSHSVPMTPSMLTPQTSIESNDRGGDRKSRKSDVDMYFGSRGPYLGLALFLRTGLQGRWATRAANTQKLRAHRIYAPTSPTGTDDASMSPKTHRFKGGLLDLPPQPAVAQIYKEKRAQAAAAATPAAKKSKSKSSLVDRLRTNMGRSSPAAVKGQVGSFPLRRQSSVSWANELTKVREIEASPQSLRPSMELTPAMRDGGLLVLLTACGGLLLKVMPGCDE